MFSSNTTQTSGGYEIQRSLRFNRPDSAYLNRTPASAGNRKTWTWSGWVKRSDIVNRQLLLEQNAGSSDTNYFGFEFASDASAPTIAIGGWNTTWRITTQVFRDVSAWYHLVLAVDTTQATANNRIRLYVNGSEITAFSTLSNPTQNADTGINSTGNAAIGAATNGANSLNGYMTEVNFIDGQALTPSSFGEINADTGVWQPKRYAGSYGTNGFYLNFSDNSNTTAATLGKDYSGNGNNWTPNNFSVSAGAGNDSLVDSPTSYGTDTGVGGTVRGNYCTLNPINTVGANTFTNGNLDVTVTNGNSNLALGTIAAVSGKWYWEVTYTSGADGMIGISDASTTASAASWKTTSGWAYYIDGSKYTNSTGASYGASYTTSDVIGVALDLDAGTLSFYKNGTSQGTAFSTGISGKTISPMVGNGANGGAQGYIANFGQRPFAYTAPSGFKALNTQNLPTPTIGATTSTQAGKYFNTILWTGNNSNPRAITGVGFQPDFSWLQRRDIGYGNFLYDAVRGATKMLASQSTQAESTYQQVNSFDADGFTQAGTVDQGNNVSGGQYVAWNWKANGAGVTNTAGSITSTVSANTTSGFSVVTWTGTGSTAGTVGHGLGVAPSFIIVKNRPVTDNWYCYHSALGNTQYIVLNTTGAASTQVNIWGSTSPTSTVFTQGTWLTNSGEGYVAYCFAEVPGYSKFGSYTGNGSTDGPFVYCGFRPAYVLFKNTSATGDWMIWDDTRSPTNVVDDLLYASLSIAEQVYTGLDFTANGFKIRNTSGDFNTSGASYIFAAFAEFPQKFSLAR